MSQSRTTPRSASVAHFHAAQPQHRPARRRAGALLMGTALSAIIGLSYGRGAYAQTVLSGAQTDTQTLTGPGEFVTEDGFSVNTTGAGGSGGDAITITTTGGPGGTTFTDSYASTITGENDGITNDKLIDGSVTITSYGTISGGQRGITVETADVPGETVDLIINAGEVSGGQDGINAVNRHTGAGSMSITTTGVVTGGSNPGHSALDAKNYSTGDLTVSAVTVDGSGGGFGLRARNYNGGDTEVVASGTTSGGRWAGLSASNDANSDNLIIQTENVYATAGTRGDYYLPGGIVAVNDGSGALSITSTGAVKDTTYAGIYATASGVGAAGTTDLDGNSLDGVSLAITANTVTGGTYGINAVNDGSGALSITTTGTVTGTTEHGIYAYNAVESPDATLTINVSSPS